MKKIAILFSGTGSNLEVLLERFCGKGEVEVALTLTNKKEAKGIEKSRRYGIEPVILEHTNFASREEFDKALVDIITPLHVDLVVLAGFMRILTPVFTSNVKAINLHPSLLPLFKGANAIKESFESDMKVGGVSVHFVGEELDGGKIISQMAFEKTPNMSLKEFEGKIHALEHKILPRAVEEVLGVAKSN